MRLLAIVAPLLLVCPMFAGATVVDLTTAGASGSIGQAFFLQIDPVESSGTGRFESFLRIQANGTERGYNTEGTLEFDTKQGQWTHILDLQDPDNAIPLVDGSAVEGLTAGVSYREFLLDIDEAKSDSLLSLDAVQIFQSDTPNNTGYPNLGTMIYDMGVGNYVLLNYELNPGSGEGDMAMYLPNSLFDSQCYVYLYSEFGLQGGSAASSDGFEEWGVRVIPEPSTLVALTAGLACLPVLRRRRQAVTSKSPAASAGLLQLPGCSRR